MKYAAYIPAKLHMTMEDAGKEAVTQVGVISPINNLELFEVRRIEVTAWVEDRQWHFEFHPKDAQRINFELAHRLR